MKGGGDGKGLVIISRFLDSRKGEHAASTIGRNKGR